MESRASIKPNALRAGDKVGLVCPSSRPATPAVVASAERIVRDMGFEPVIGNNVLSVSGFMAGSDEERLADLVGFMEDDSIKAIFVVTGGFGSLHLLPFLNYEAFARAPKIVMGCGEPTALLNALHQRSGVVCLHGPNLDQIKTRDTFDRVRAAVTGKEPLAELNALQEEDRDLYRGHFYCSVSGTAEGILIGGNLTALTGLLGTPFEPNTTNSILFLEDANEQNGILDRWFTSLYLGAHLQRCAAVAAGSFENCHPRGSMNMLSVMDTFSDRLKYLSKTSCFGMPFGQTKNTNVVPIGVRARLNSDKGLLEFLEPALS